jgi:protein ImuB
VSPNESVQCESVSSQAPAAADDPPAVTPPAVTPPAVTPPAVTPPAVTPPVGSSRRVLTIWLPRWPVQRRLLERPELRRVPLFVCRRERRGVLIVVSFAWAETPRVWAETPRRTDPLPGITPGMSLAEAMAVLALARGSRACHIAVTDHDDPAADRLALERLARWCHRFSPAVMVEPAAEGRMAGGCGDVLHLDVTGTAGFFGGEESLVRTAVWTLAARGLHARAAIADTPAAAYAAAHHTDRLADRHAADRHAASRRIADRRIADRRGHQSRTRRSRGKCRWAVVPRGEAATRLADLPAASLRLAGDTLAALRDVGIETIGGVLRLPVKSIASRFPADLGRRRAQLLGTLAEPWTAPQVPLDDLPQAEEQFDVPVASTDLTADTITALVERLLGRCLAALEPRGVGALAVQVRLQSTDRAPAVVDVGLFQPSQSLRHLVELVQLRLGRVRLPRELVGIAVEVVAAGPAMCRQRSLFDDSGLEHVETAASRSVATGMLLDRLAGRLGRAAVFEPRIVADPQPEHAWIPAAPARPSGREPAGGLPGRRPLWMAPRPLPLADILAVAKAFGLQGPPARFRVGGSTHVVVAAHGPERIETAWWRGPTVRRDYYVVETESGARFWVFRRLRDGGWFLHGMFA